MPGTMVRFVGGKRIVTKTKGYKRLPRPKTVRVLKSSKALTTRIKQVLNRQSETKYAANNIIDQYIVPYTCGPAGLFFPCLAQVLQGTQSNQRVGERIKPVRARVDFIINFDPTSTQSHDYRVKLFVVKPKDYQNFIEMVNSAFTGRFLDNGNQTSADWDPLNPHISDCKPVDNEFFSPIMTKTFKLIKNTSTVEGSLPGAGNTPNTSRSSVVKYSMSLYGKALKQHLAYTGSTAAYPQNYNPIFTMVAYAADGTAPQIVSPIKASVRLHLWYKDE